MTDHTDLRVVRPTSDFSDEFAGELSHVRWREIGLTLAREHRASDFEWRIGDWAALAQGEFATLAEAAGILGESEGNLKKYASAAKVFPKVRRRTSVGFSLHLEVVALPETERDRLLDLAAAEHWTRSRMRQEARGARNASCEAGLRSRIAHLERDLAKARGEKSRAEAALGRMERAVADAIGDATRAWAAIDKVTAAFFDGDDPDGAAGVHGNAEIKAAKRLLSKLAACGRTVNAMAERIDARLTAHTVPRTRRP